MIATVGRLGNLSYWAGILAFICLAIASVISPWLGSRKTTKAMNKPNGASKKFPELMSEDFSDYNLYDLCLQALLNSKAAKDDAAAAASLAGMTRTDVRKIQEHLGMSD
jgi:hypothetical protein